MKLLIDISNGFSDKDECAIESRLADMTAEEVVLFSSGKVTARIKRQPKHLDMEYGGWNFRRPLPDDLKTFNGLAEDLLVFMACPL